MSSTDEIREKTVVRSHQEELNRANRATDAAVDENVEHVETEDGNLVYNDVDEEPELHVRTYVALIALFLLNFVQVYALQGPPAVVRQPRLFQPSLLTEIKLSWIGKDLNNPLRQTWISVSLTLVQAVLSPVIASASDTYQARKPILVGSCLLSLVGAAIAPGSKDIYRLIGAQCLIGVGFAAVPLAYAVPSEILPRKWRPSKCR
jgi:MFS family permease